MFNSISAVLLAVCIFSVRVQANQENIFLINKNTKQIVLMASNVEVQKEVLDEEMVPRGSAVLTSSGKLKEQGIEAIIHAAPAAMTKSHNKHFGPTVESIKNSIYNSIKIAELNGYQSIAIPFLGGGIFFGSMGLSKNELVAYIIDATVESVGKKIKAVLVAYGEEDTKIFEDEWKKFKSRAKDKNIDQVSVVSGSILDKSVHKSEVIVNAANMEVSFGGGLSGLIGRKTGEAALIDAEAKKIISAFAGDYRVKQGNFTQSQVAKMKQKQSELITRIIKHQKSNPAGQITQMAMELDKIKKKIDEANDKKDTGFVFLGLGATTTAIGLIDLGTKIVKQKIKIGKVTSMALFRGFAVSGVGLASASYGGWTLIENGRELEGLRRNLVLTADRIKSLENQITEFGGNIDLRLLKEQQILDRFMGMDRSFSDSFDIESF